MAAARPSIARRLVAGHGDGAAREPTRALFVPPIANFKAARTLALDDDVAVQRAQFDLANVATGSIDLFRN